MRKLVPATFSFGGSNLHFCSKGGFADWGGGGFVADAKVCAEGFAQVEGSK